MDEDAEIFQFDDRAKRRHGSGADRRIGMLHEREYRACRRRDPAITYETDHQRQRPRVAAGEPRHDHLVDAVGRHGRDRLADRRKHGRPVSGRDLQQPRRGRCITAAADGADRRQSYGRVVAAGRLEDRFLHGRTRARGVSVGKQIDQERPTPTPRVRCGR